MHRRSKTARLCTALHIPRNAWHVLCVPSLLVERPGKANSFTFSCARLNKPTTWSLSETEGNWAAFYYNYGRALEGFCWFPWSQVLHWVLYKLAMLGLPVQSCVQEAPKPYFLLLSACCQWLFPELFINVHKSFFNGHFNSRLTRQPLKQVDNLSVLSVFRIFCSSLPSALFCPQWDLFAFKYSVSKSKESTMPKPSFSCNIAITEEMRCYLFGLAGMSSGVIFERRWWQRVVSSPLWVPSAQDNWPFSPGHNWAGFEIMDQVLPFLWLAVPLSCNVSYLHGLF